MKAMTDLRQRQLKGVEAYSGSQFRRVQSVMVRKVCRLEQLGLWAELLAQGPVQGAEATHEATQPMTFKGPFLLPYSCLPEPSLKVYSLPKPHHWLGTKFSNTRDSKKYFTSKP